jgi:hypothetical protein
VPRVAYASSIEADKSKDYDCFYASVFEAENPALRAMPLGVQQKHIIVTCNYEARRRGLRKLQLITEAKKMCPEVVIGMLKILNMRTVTDYDSTSSSWRESGPVCKFSYPTFQLYISSK